MEEKIIDGVDVAGCVHLDEWKHCNICKELIKTIPDRHQCLTEQDLRCEYYSNCYYKQLKRLEQSHNKLYDDLLEVVKPYLSDFTGYDEKEQCFNIVLAVKEILGQLEQENEALKEKAYRQADYDYQLDDALDNLRKLEQENEELKQTIKDLTQSLDDCNVQRTQLKARLTPFEDSYFNGLSSIEIAGLAKKSIRITTYNRKLETALEEIKKLTIIGINASQCNCGLRALADDILHIITEAIGNELLEE